MWSLWWSLETPPGAVSTPFRPPVVGLHLHVLSPGSPTVCPDGRREPGQVETFALV